MIRFAIKKSPIYNQKTLYKLAVRTEQRRNFHSNIQEAGLGKYLIILTPLAVGSGVVAYAKHDNDFRKTLINNVPAIDPVLKILLQEEGNAVSEASKTVSNATQSVVSFKDSVVGYFSGEKSAETPIQAPVTATQKKASSTVTVTSAPPLPAITASMPNKNSTDASSTQKPKVASSPTDTKPSEPIKLSPVKPEPLPTTLSDLEKDLDVAAQIAIKEYNNSIKILNEYANDVRVVVDRVIENSDNTVWAALKNKTAARDTAVEAAERTANEARNRINLLEKHIASVGKNVASDVLEKTRRSILFISDQLNKSKEELYNAKDAAHISEKYWKKLEEARNYFVDQVQSLFPGVDLNAKSLNLSKEEIDLFIMHAYSHVLAYQKELQKIHTDGEIRLRRALDALKGEDQTEATQRQLEYLLEKEKQTLNIENEKKIFRIKAEMEANLRQQLKTQSEAHSDHLGDALAEREKELRRIFNRELNEKLSVEQSAYKIQLATILGKLKGMDSALKARTDADHQVHQAQALWSACSALWLSMRTFDPKKPWQNQVRPLKNEVQAVSQASEQDELVQIVLKSLPEEAKNRGVYPENAIRERFLKVEQLARRLALVPEKDATIVTYILSYLQSILIIQPKELISKPELDNELIDFSQLTTFDILDRTRYFVDRGNFVQALKYANLLKGASRNIASDWINETKLLLETQQAVRILLSHAATSGLAFL